VTAAAEAGRPQATAPKQNAGERDSGVEIRLAAADALCLCNGMNAIEEYLTVVAADAKELDAKVSELLKKGFQPYGSPYLASGPESITLFQALTRGRAARVFGDLG
jgi:hypothetical protein